MAKRILIVVNSAKFFLSHRLPVGLAARAAGYDVHVATAPEPEIQKINDAGLTAHAIALSRRGMNPLSELAGILELRRLYRELKPDLVHHVTIKPVLYGSLAAQLAAVPAVVNAVPGLGFIYTATGFVAGLRRKLVNMIYRLALRHKNQRVIFQNRDDYTLLESMGVVRAGDVVFIKGSGVNLSDFQPHPEADGVVTVVLPARLLMDKGVREFVEAAKILKSREVAVRMALVGDSDFGNPTAVTQAELDGWVRDNIIEWWGFRSDMPDVLKSAHIVCLPSYREGLPKSLIEACAAGRPIVTCDVPGCRDVVDQGVNGLLVPARDAAALADALQTLIRDADLRARMGTAGRARAEAEFSIDNVIEKHLAIYAELLADPR